MPFSQQCVEMHTVTPAEPRVQYGELNEISGLPGIRIGGEDE